jgi:hypothetical protein
MLVLEWAACLDVSVAKGFAGRSIMGRTASVLSHLSSFVIDSGYSSRTRRMRRPILLQFPTEKLLNSVSMTPPLKNVLLNSPKAAV